ncbi:MAG: anti-sigma factor [Candidatus Zixiibacteriota bacterium]
MTHDDAYELLDSYVLGTLTPEEHRDVEVHLATNCPDCVRRLRELDDVCTNLAAGLPQHNPPAHLKGRVMSSVQAHSAPGRSSRSGQRINVGWLVAGLSVAAAVILFFQYQNAQRDIAELRRELTETQDVTDLLGMPGMSFADLEGVGPNEQAFGKVVVDPMRGEAVVFMYALPESPEGMEYQLWVMRDGQPTSVGTFTVNEDGSAMIMLDEIEEEEMPQFLVTIEPAGGRPAPTGMMYLTSPGIGNP